jgi:CBS domain-containing protein
VATVPPSTSVRDALAELRRHNVGALVVSVDGQRIDGIVSERDVVRSLVERGPALLDDPVSRIMSSEVETCSPADDTEHLMAVMTERRVRHLPVVEGGVLRGIVSIGDVVKHRLRELEKDREELVAYIHAR